MDRLELLHDNEEALRTAMDGRLVGLHTALPGIIEDIDFEKQTVSVQPAIQGVLVKTAADGTISYQNVNLPLLKDVPVFFPRGGDYAITFPIKAGDECLVVFAERCIDSWWANGGIGPQIEFRTHDLSDGFAIVGFSSVPNTIPSIDSDKLQIRKLDGSTYIELSEDGIKLTTDQDLVAEVDGDVTIDADNMQLTAEHNLSLNADVINLTCNTLNIDAGVINYL